MWSDPAPPAAWASRSKRSRAPLSAAEEDKLRSILAESETEPQPRD